MISENCSDRAEHKVKICGMVTEEDIAIVNETRPDYVGFVLEFPKSKRNCSVERARQLIKRLNPDIMRVAVMV